MIVTNVRLQRIEVANYSFKAGAEFKLFFNDGNNKVITFESDLSDPEQDAAKIMSKLRTYEKELNKPQFADNFLEDFVNVQIFEEEKSQGKISHFISSLKEKARAIRLNPSGTGYLDSLNLLKSMKREL